jgi:hypothetical protein
MPSPAIAGAEMTGRAPVRTERDGYRLDSMVMHGVSAHHAASVNCPICYTPAQRACQFVGGDHRLRGRPMSLFHASRYLC